VSTRINDGMDEDEVVKEEEKAAASHSTQQE